MDHRLNRAHQYEPSPPRDVGDLRFIATVRSGDCMADYALTTQRHLSFMTGDYDLRLLLTSYSCAYSGIVHRQSLDIRCVLSPERMYRKVCAVKTTYHVCNIVGIVGGRSQPAERAILSTPFPWGFVISIGMNYCSNHRTGILSVINNRCLPVWFHAVIGVSFSWIRFCRQVFALRSALGAK